MNNCKHKITLEADYNYCPACGFKAYVAGRCYHCGFDYDPCELFGEEDQAELYIQQTLPRLEELVKAFKERWKALTGEDWK